MPDQEELGSIVISSRSASILRFYLLDHERDIAYGINDFGELKGLFVEIFNREPSKEVPNE